MTGRIETHRGFMRGSYLGTDGAFVGATVVPQRAVPRLAVEHPMVLSAPALSVTAVAWAVVAASRRGGGTTRESHPARQAAA